MVFLCALAIPGRAGATDALESQFQHPAESASPWVFWYWMQGNVSREGITADLEAMREIGIGGAYLMPIQGPADPPLMDPPVEQLTPEFWGMVRHAMQEAERLGLKIGMHACDGFAVAGGPWITPELSMQRVVWTETTVEGGRRFEGDLPQPETNEGYYRDIAVLAFPSPQGTGTSTRTKPPTVTTSVPGVDAGALAVPGNTERVRIEGACWIQYAFDTPFTCRSIIIRPDGNNFQAKRLRVEASDDGKTFRNVGLLESPRHGWQDAGVPLTYAIEPTTARFFRFLHDTSGSEPGSEDLDSAKWKPVLKIEGIELSSAPRIHHYEGKSARIWRIAPRTTTVQVPDELCVPLEALVDVTAQSDGQGRLRWDAPAGTWTILRIGHTSTGQRNETAGGGKGLECDKFNPAAVRLQFDRWFGEAIRQAGPERAGEVLSVFHVDSWECGSQNWSPVFREEFRRRRGYDLLPYLPTMAGIPVESVEASERFLRHMRQTIAELVADQFYGTMRELAHDAGCRFTGECTAPTMPGDGMLHFRELDTPMGEFWLRSPTHDKPNDMLDAISGAHIYGKPIVQAEAFTQLRIGWDEHPGLIKAIGDRNYCLGINRLVYHVFTHNPWLDRQPGMTLNGVGLYFQRDQTWWEAGNAWVDYARRCQALLQQGRPVVDVAVFTGEELPRRAVLPDRLVSALPGIFGEEVVQREARRLANEGEPQRAMPEGVGHSANMADPEDWVDPLRGYAYDSINRDALLRLSEVRDGRIELPGGASYGVLVIPGPRPMSPSGGAFSPEMTERLNQLVAAGASVILVDPSAAPIGTATKRVIRGPYRHSSFASLGIERDVWVTEPNGEYAGDIAWTHRRAGDTDIYFISNQLNERRPLELALNVSGRVPELWDPVSGAMRDAQQWRIDTGRTLLPVKLEAQESIFVVLRKPTEEERRDDGLNWVEPQLAQEMSGPWRVGFESRPGSPENPLQLDGLTDWSAHSDPAVRHFSGTATYTTTFALDGATAENTRQWLDLGQVGNLAVVTVNGMECGTAWTAPFRVEVTSALTAGENRLRVDVTNPWHNRLVHEALLPENERTAWMNAPNRLRDKPLLPAGLLGPVTLLSDQ